MTKLISKQHFEMMFDKNGCPLEPFTLMDGSYVNGLGIKSLNGVTLQNNCIVVDLNLLQNIEGLTVGKDCYLKITNRNCDLGTPKVSPDELEIINQIDPQNLNMADFHCGTTHCLAGWAQYITKEYGTNTEDVGRKYLPSLAHLFYCCYITEAVHKMIVRLQTPKTPTCRL